jgi:hypothetical protein
MRGRLALLAFAVLGCSAAHAEDAGWAYDPDNNKAVAIQNDHLLAVLCGEDNQVVVYYSVPQAELNKALVNRKTPYLAIAIDEGVDGLSGYSVKATPMSIDDAQYFAFQGRAAGDIAKKIGKAHDSVFVTVSTKNPATAGKNYPKFHSNIYSTEGADEAMATLFENCPQD